MVNAFHKMGRQLLAWGQIGFYAWAVYNRFDITMELVAGVSGVTAMYTVAKGKGQ